MAELPLEQAIPRYKQNEDRVNTFVNGSETTTWQTSDGGTVPSIRKFLKDQDTYFDDTIDTLIVQKSAEINLAADGVLAQATAAMNSANAAMVSATSSATSASEDASSANSSANSAAASATEAETYALIVGAAAFDFNYDSDPTTPGYDWND